MNNQRPYPPPALVPGPGLEPDREFFTLGGWAPWISRVPCFCLRKHADSRANYTTSVYVHRPGPGLGQGKGEKLPVLYVHGIQSHPGWFFGSAQALARAGHVVYQVTRRGSGDNTRQRGHAHDKAQLYRDLITCIEQICQRDGTGRLHLLGVSWGGKLALACLARNPGVQAKVASLMLVAPGISSLVDLSLGRKLALVSCLALPVVNRLTGLVRFEIPLGRPELFTGNPAMQEYLRSDAFSLRRATARFLYVSRRMDFDLKFARRGAVACPTTLILASDDRIIDNDATEARVAKLTADKLRTVRLGGAHTLEFEQNPKPFFEELTKNLARE